MTTTTAEQLQQNLVVRDSGCVEWTGRCLPRGYGCLYIPSRGTVLTHRFAWELANGPIPAGIHVLHHCDNPPCCQTDPTPGYPDGHLFLGTDADNAADRDAKGRAGVNAQGAKTHCIHGHAYTEANTRRQRNGRACIECEHIHNRARRAS